MTAVFTDYFSSGSHYTVTANGITLKKKSNNKITPIKGSNPVIVRLGRTATIIVTCRIYGTTDFDVVNAWGGETVIIVSSSSYHDLPNGNYLLKSFESKVKPGNLGVYDAKFELEYYYSGSVI